MLDMIKIKHNYNGKTEHVYNVYLLNDGEYRYGYFNADGLIY